MKIILGDSPDQEGTYVVYEDVYVPYARKVFLTYIKNEWWYTGSDQKFRGTIVGYIGPFPSPKIVDLVGDPDIRYAIGILPDGMHGVFKDGPSITAKELTELPGDEGDFIFKLQFDKEAEVIGKWSEEKQKWLRRRT